MLLKDTVYLLCITNLALISGKKAISDSKGQSTLECCKTHNVQGGCLGLCTPAEKNPPMYSKRERNTNCTQYNDVIELCFQVTEPGIKAQWEEWEEYTECTKTCGSGNKWRTRACNIPGKCPSDGEIKQTILCNAQACPKPTISTTTEFTDYTDGDDSMTTLEIATTAETYPITTLPPDDADDKRCKPFVDCNKDNEVALKYCPNYCLEEEICKTVDCTKPKASTLCPISCAEGRHEDTEICKIVDCTKPKASTLCPISCAEEPEPPTKPATCDYGHYCALVDCTKTGSADLCPDQCMLDLNCKCDSKGKQMSTNPQNQQNVEWCWLDKSPCRLLTGNIVPSNHTWVMCYYQSAMQIDCSEPKISTTTEFDDYTDGDASSTNVEIPTTTEFDDYTDGDASSTNVEIPTTTEPYLLTTLPSDDVKGYAHEKRKYCTGARLLRGNRTRRNQLIFDSLEAAVNDCNTIKSCKCIGTTGIQGWYCLHTGTENSHVPSTRVGVWKVWVKT